MTYVATIMVLGVPPADAGLLGKPVFFDSAVYPPTPFKIKKAKEQGVELEPAPATLIWGYLSRPKGEGPFPAVVVMHGCGGIWRWDVMWIETLVDWGYVVLAVDSFRPRGVESVCDASRVVGGLTRALDAHGAKSYLAGVTFVDPARIAVLGMSQGGSSVLQAIDRSITTKVGGEPFQAAVALYPVCEPYTQPNAPILILIGELDNWVDPAHCERYLAKLGSEHDVTLKIYPGAHHVFDLVGIDSLWRGHYVMRYDPEAAQDAMKRVRAFLATHLQ